MSHTSIAAARRSYTSPASERSSHRCATAAIPMANHTTTVSRRGPTRVDQRTSGERALWGCTRANLECGHAHVQRFEASRTMLVASGGFPHVGDQERPSRCFFSGKRLPFRIVGRLVSLCLPPRQHLLP